MGKRPSHEDSTWSPPCDLEADKKYESNSRIGSRANRRGGIHLSKPNSGLGETIKVGCDQVLGTIAIGIEGSLVIGVDDDHVGAIRIGRSDPGENDPSQGAREVLHDCCLTH